MASISFYAGSTFIDNIQGSGLGFYSTGFGNSIAVGEFQGKTYVTNGAGTSLGVECNNIKYQNTGSGIIGQASSGIALTAIPNSQVPLNVRFEHSSAVQVQSAELRIYDRSNINNDPTGVLCYTAEIIHPNPTQVNTGSGDTTWTNTHGSGVTLSLSKSPGTSGQYAGNGSNSAWTDTRHDWYLAISASPNTIGSKTNFGAYVSAEYF